MMQVQLIDILLQESSMCYGEGVWVGKFEAESIREVIGLQRYIRKHKALTMMKNVLAQERHEKELAN